jgi:DNA repair protein SbcD/Mre11
MIKVLHFADAHIDIARFGRHDAETGLPLRVMDFLKALDVIVDFAIQQKVDLVIFSGDAYRDRTPAPTFQREWGKRMKRLSQAKLPTLLVVGNHDLSPAAGRAHALQEYETLEVPFIRVISQPALLNSKDLFGLPLQIIGLPWMNSASLKQLQTAAGDGLSTEKAEPDLQLQELLKRLLDKLDPDLPAILAAHASVEGAMYGNERGVMLGRDVILPAPVTRDKRLDYVALGHIHKPQELNHGGHPPAVYPGSIERVNFGEVEDEKQFVLAFVEKGKTRVEWHKLSGRSFFDRRIELASSEDVEGQIIKALPTPLEMKDAIVRLTLSYPHEWEAFIDETAIRRHAQDTFEFHFLRHPQLKSGTRVRGEESLLGKTTSEQLVFYWANMGMNETDIRELKPLAEEVMARVETGELTSEDEIP